MIEVNRIDLKKYYKEVKDCRLCKKPYGLDNTYPEKSKGICPVCLRNLHSPVKFI